MELTGITQDYDGLVDLLVREQFLQCCPKEMATVLKEHSIKNLGELASLAEKYIEARGNNSFTNCVGKNNSRNPRQFAIKNKILIRERTDDPANVTSQVVVPTKYRETVKVSS